jgi:hypothetical protein
MADHIESIFLAAFFFPAVAAVLIFFMKYVSAILQARVRLAEIQSRLTAVEKILKDVE